MRQNLMTDEQRINYQSFQKQEAFDLMNTIVAHETYKNDLDDLDISLLGIVSGVLEINDEVEIVIRFPAFLEQATKSEYLERYCVVERVDSQNN